jgi:hypothetical protein
MAKRRRKPSQNSEDKIFFSTKEEEAVVKYLQSDDAAEKNRIYESVLRPAFKKMVESIIRRYNLYIPDEDFEETKNDVLSFVLTKANKFKPERHKKAYSYYGTICKNYLIGRLDSHSKSLSRYESYDENGIVSTFGDKLKYSDYSEKNKQIASDSVEMLIKKIDVMINDPSAYNLKESEVKLGQALKTLLENWDFVLSTDGSSKLNKYAILLFLKDSTGFDTKAIRDNMKKYKAEFYSIKKFLLS